MLIVANIISFHLAFYFLIFEKVTCHCDSPTDFNPKFLPIFDVCHYVMLTAGGVLYSITVQRVKHDSPMPI